MECHTLQIDFGNLVDVLLVLTAHQDVCDACTLGGKDLLLDAPDRQHFATKGDLTGHGSVLANLTLGEGRGDGCGDGDTSRRTVLGGRSLRHMDMDVPVVEDAVVNVQRLRMGLHILQCEDGAFLHHVTEVASQRKLRALALRE